MPLQATSILEEALTDLRRTIFETSLRTAETIRASAPQAFMALDTQHVEYLPQRLDTRATHPRSALQTLSTVWGDILPRTDAMNQLTRLSVLHQAQLHILVHVLSNNMFDKLGFQNLGALWSFLRQAHGRHFRQGLAQIVCAFTSKELVWRFLQAAIEDADAAGVEFLVRVCRVNVNEIICIGWDREQFSAVEVAAGLMHGSVLRVLSQNGADVNMTGRYTRKKSKIDTGGALYWLLNPHAMSYRLSGPSTGPLSGQVCDFVPAPSELLGVLQLLITAGLKPTPKQKEVITRPNDEPVGRRFAFSHLWTVDALKQLAATVMFTDLSWIFELTLRDVMKHTAISTDFITGIVDWCYPEDRACDNIWESTDRDCLLDIMVSNHHGSGINRLLARGAKLASPLERCCSLGTLSECLRQQTSARADHQPDSPLDRIPQPRKTRKNHHLASLEELIFQPRYPLDTSIQFVLKQNLRQFWKMTLKDHGAHVELLAEDILLLKALQLCDDQFVRELLEFRQEALPCDLDILKAAHHRSHLGFSNMVITRPDSQMMGSAILAKDVIALEAMIALGIRVDDEGGTLRRQACSTGDYMVLQRCLDLILQAPLEEFERRDTGWAL